MIAPHTSTKYAVVFVPTIGGYLIAAVHGVMDDWMLVSIQFPVGGEAHVYHAPVMIDTDDVRALAQTSEMAWKYKRHLEEQDREVEEANRR